MLDQKQLDQPNASKEVPMLLPFIPVTYDWRQSNCDEKRSGLCRPRVEKADITH
jgi:hypothetical protein